MKKFWFCTLPVALIETSLKGLNYVFDTDES